MAVTEDVAKLILQTIGADGVEDLRKKIAAIPDEMGHLAAAFGRGEVSMEDYDKEAQRLSQTHKQLSGALDQLEKKAGSAKSGMAGLGQAGLQTGRVIQDFAQGGIGGILNNLEGLSMALGGGPGLAGILTGVGVAFFLLKKPIAEFFESLSGDQLKPINSELDTLKGRIKELEDKKIKLGVDTEELDKAKARIKELEAAEKQLQAIKEGRTVEQKEAGEEISGVFASEPERVRAATAKMIEEQRQKNITTGKQSEALRALERQRQQTGKMIEQMEMDLGERGLDPEARAGLLLTLRNERENRKKILDQILQAQQAARKDAETEVAGLFEQVGKGNNPGAREDLAARLRRAGEHGLAETTAATTPEEMARQAQIDAELEASIERQKAGEKARKEKKERAEKAQKTMLDAQDAIDEDNLRQSTAGMKRIADEKKAADRLAGKAVRRDHADVVKQAKAAHDEIVEQARAMDGFQARAEAALAAGIQGGRFRMGADGQLDAASFQRLVEAISGELRQVMPGMTPFQAAALPQQLAANTETGVGQKLLAQVGAVPSAQLALQNVIAETQAAVARLAGQVQQVHARNGQLMCNNAQLNRMMDAGGPTNLNMGAP